MKKLVIRPSVAISGLADGSVSIYYYSGKKHLQVRLNDSERSSLEKIILKGLEIESNAATSQLSSLERELISREILVSDSHSPTLWPSKFERFDRQLRYISDRCAPSESPVDILQKILESKICLVGLGGLGTNILQQLVPMGFCNFLLIDPDQVDVSNLNRTAIYCPDDAGKSKVSVCETWIRNRTSDSSIEGATSILDDQVLTRILNFSPDVVINCADNPSIFDSTRKLIKNLKQRNIPILVGGGYFLGNSFSGPFILPQERGCLDCFADKREDANISKVGGSISPFPSIAASISSLDLFNFVTKLDPIALHRRQIIFEADSISFKYRDLPANELCPTCG